MPFLFALHLASIVAITPYPPVGTKNMLVIVVDDMRPWFEPYSSSGVLAPNLRRLASTSMVFNNTYVQQAVCSPSRNSFMTGRRPDSTRTWNFRTSFRESGVDASGRTGDNWTTWPEAFKNSGWNVVGLGKVFHPQHPKNNDCISPRTAVCRSWSTAFHSTDPSDVTITGNNATVVSCDKFDGNCNFTYGALPGQVTSFTACYTVLPPSSFEVLPPIAHQPSCGTADA
jgi:hypothetical protein